MHEQRATNTSVRTDLASVREATIRAIYTLIVALAQSAALTLSPNIIAMDNAEIETNATENFDADRPWQNYKSRLPAGR
jgi:hypothetical protein